MPRGYKKSLDLELNGTFSSGDTEPQGEILMNLETLAKVHPNELVKVGRLVSATKRGLGGAAK